MFPAVLRELKEQVMRRPQFTFHCNGTITRERIYV